ncbi:MAG: hypothetical protein JNK05_41535 [Myxococcales bacterium]|nr:hypothetical protein [Myxococcales bacterium]
MRKPPLALALCLAAAPLAQATPSFAQTNASAPSTVSLLRQADAAYDVSDYGTALSLYQAAYRQAQEPTILNNVARVQARLGRWQDAVDTWQRFLERMPSAPNRVQVEASIRDAQLHAEQERQNAERQRQVNASVTSNATQGNSGVVPRAEVAPRDAARPPIPVPIGAWVTVGVGGAAMIGGGVLLGLHASAVAELQRAENCAPNGAGGFNCEPSARDIHSRAQTMGTAGAIVLSVGGAAAIGGVVWAIVGRRSESPSSVRAWITPNSVVVGGRF